MVSTKFHTPFDRHWISWCFWKNFGTLQIHFTFPTKEKKLSYQKKLLKCTFKRDTFNLPTKKKTSIHPFHPISCIFFAHVSPRPLSRQGQRCQGRLRHLQHQGAQQGRQSSVSTSREIHPPNPAISLLFLQEKHRIFVGNNKTQGKLFLPDMWSRFWTIPLKIWVKSVDPITTKSLPRSCRACRRNYL